MEMKDLLKKLRKERNYSAQEVADGCEISLGVYKKYESGERGVGVPALQKLADFYGVTTDYLLGREPLPNPFADVNLSEDDEAEVIAKYMSLPPEIRACMLDVLVQLGDAAKKRQSDSAQSSAQKIDVTYSKIYADEGGVTKKETPAGLPKISEFFDD